MLLYPYPFSLQEKLKDRFNFFSFEDEISKLTSKSMLIPLFLVDAEELTLYDKNDKYGLQITFERAIKECNRHCHARVSYICGFDIDPK